MKRPVLYFSVVRASHGLGLSVRLGPGDATASGFKEALTTAGFKAGDAVRMTLAPKKRRAA